MTWIVYKLGNTGQLDYYNPVISGASSSQYGLVFGIANLALFLTAPLFGRFGPLIGAKILCNTGSFVQAFCGLAFGFLDYIPDVNIFLGFSYLLR